VGLSPAPGERTSTLELQLPPRPPSVAEARHQVHDLLVDAGRDDLVDTCVLLVSEVVTNALLHAGTVMSLRAALGPDGVRVEVRDGSPHLPAPRGYAATSGTGRGLRMLESMVADWGVTRHDQGKTVWFEVAADEGSSDSRPGTAPRQTDGHGRPAGRQATVSVDLLNMPLLLHAAWQEHAEALLREYLLASLDSMDSEDGGDPIRLHADATDAIAVLEEHTPRSGQWTIDDELFSDAAEPAVSAALVRIPVPVESLPHFETLDRVVGSAAALAEEGQVLTPPTLPAVEEFRRWVCGQVLGQPAGLRPEPWSVPVDVPVQPKAPPGWDDAGLAGAGRGVIAANSASQILAVSPEAARILGYDDGAELVGQRITSIIPERLRQAHVAGFTMYLLVGRKPLVGRRSLVPALRRDGTEVEIELLIREQPLGGGGSVLLAEVREAGPAIGVAG
jgi:PAS domain S-box-containing protein